VSIKTIKKRDGTVVDFNPEKMLRWAEWAGVVGADWFAVMGDAYNNCPQDCTTTELQTAMIRACMDREDTPHLLMAGRLLIGEIYKNAFGGYDNIPTVKEMYKSMVVKGLWEEMGYTDEELDKCQHFINHNLDLRSIHSVVHQISTKYAIRDIEKGGIPLESPAFVWMRMALGVCATEPIETRIDEVAKYYNDFSLGKINAPTPNIVNLGTPKKTYASCCIFKVGDTSDSLAAGDHIAYKMTCASAGIGGYLETRSKGDGVRNNTIKHAGKLPYYRSTEAAVHANLQGGRGGAATVYFNCLDPEVFTLLRLRHPTTVAKSRIGGIDYCFSYHPLFAKKAASNEDWMLVSFQHGPELWKALYSGEEGVFEEAYEKYEASNGKRKYVKARKLALEFLRMQQETGRMYECNTYEMNRHTPFKDTIWSSNLCLETGLATEEFNSVKDLYSFDEDTKGEIALCNLAAIVAGRVRDEEYSEVAYRALKMVDNIINMMDYPFPHLKYTAQARRSAGIGITNLANDMAERGLKYTTQEGKQYIHELAEKHSYWLHVASVRLAKERGKCDWYSKTKYSDGWLPIDTACNNPALDFELKMNWQLLRNAIKQHGMRNTVLEAFMPVESSSIAGNTTNGLYPIREPVVIKTSGTNKSVFIAPDWESLKGAYQMAWDIPTKDLTEGYGLVQKFCGQAISADWYIKFEEGKPKQLSAKKMLEDWFYRIKCGLKTKYYTNSASGLSVEESCAGCKL